MAATTWADLAGDILEVAYNCLASTPLGLPAEKYLSENEAEFSCCDFISVHISDIKRMKNGKFPEENFMVNNCDSILYVPQFTVELGRPCRPITTNSRVDPTGVPQVKRNLFGHNTMVDENTLFCCLDYKLNNTIEIGGRVWKADFFMGGPLKSSYGYCHRFNFKVLLNTCACE